MNINNVHERNIKNDFLSKINKNVECEIRFGTYNKHDNKTEFIPGVSIEYFYRLKKELSKIQDIDKKKIYTKEISNEGDIRKIVYTDENFENDIKEEYMIKNVMKRYDIYDYETRFSLASERILTLLENEKKVLKPVFYRYKKRFTYKIKDIGKIDLTIVKQNSNESNILDSEQIFEVEFEIETTNYASVTNMLTFLIHIKQNNFYIITQYEKRSIYYQYKKLIMGDKSSFIKIQFIGSQPETLQKDQLSLLYKELYSVTDKADGDRYFLFIDDSRNVYYIDTNLNILKTNLTSTKYKSTLIDGELIKQKNKYVFYGFDILFMNGCDLRGNTEYLLTQRLDVLNKVLQTINNTNEYEIFMKKFIFRNVFIGSEVIMNEINEKLYKNDGLIFTPMNEPYPITKKWKKLLKWKPSELNTIDLYSVKNGNIWELYVQGPITNIFSNHIKTETVLFDVSKLNCEPSNVNTFQTTFSDDLIDPSSNESYKTNTVIEYSWDILNKKFVPLRTRWDKTQNKSKHGNYVSVACSIWNNIHNPIEKDLLYKMTNSSTVNSTENIFFFERMILFKAGIIDNIKKSVDANLLEIYNDKINNPILKKYYKINGSENLCDIILKNCDIQFNTLLIYNLDSFFKSRELFDSLINILHLNLNKNGKCVFIFIDSKKLSQTSPYFIQNNEILYYIKQCNQGNQGLFNNQYKLFINDKNRNENNIINIDENFLLTELSKNGFNCIENKSFCENKEKNLLLNYENNILDLYKYCIFEYTDLNTFVKPIKPTVLKTNINCNINIIEHKYLQFYNIKCTYDIYDILNCIEYNIYKNKYNNVIVDINILTNLKEKEFNFVLLNNLNEENNTKNNNICCFVNKLTPEIIETTESNEEDNIYIVLYKNQILQPSQNIKIIYDLINNYKEETKEETKKETKKELKEETKKELKEEIKKEVNIKETIKKEMSLNKKITLIQIKDYLKQLNEKTIGNKEILLNKLIQVLN